MYLSSPQGRVRSLRRYIVTSFACKALLAEEVCGEVVTSLRRYVVTPLQGYIGKMFLLLCLGESGRYIVTLFASKALLAEEVCARSLHGYVVTWLGRYA